MSERVVTVKTAILLSAGRGERLRPLTDTIPKPLLEIGGRTLAERHLRALAAAGTTRVVINLSWLGERLVERLGDGQQFGLQILYADEGPAALGTAGGIVNALPLLGREPFWVVNGDVFTDFDFSPLALEADELVHLLLVPNPPHNVRGDFALQAGKLRNAGPGGDRPLTYCGIGLYRHELFADCPAGASSLVPLLRAAANAGRARATLFRGAWDDIGTPERLSRRRELCAGDAQS